MAALARDSAPGTWRILFVDADGRRRTIRLGRLDRRAADGVLRHVETLLACKLAGQPIPRDTALWVGALGPVLRQRLARAGLIEARPEPERCALGEFLDDYIRSRVDIKPSTRTVLDQARRRMIEFFGADKPIDRITTKDADAYRAWLIEDRGLARNSVAKLTRYGRHYMAVAIRRKIIGENPFVHLPATVGGNPARHVFVPASDVEQVIDVTVDLEWRALLALARYQGLRIPSEALALTWSDVDFVRRRLIIRASKTAHHEGGGIRVTPIFPETMPHLQALYDSAEPGAQYVITRYRDAGQNLRTQLERLILRAGLTPWPQLWQALRRSRATELAAVFPGHLCAAWLGHTQKVANMYYRMVTDMDFERAIGWRTCGSVSPQAQNPAHYLRAPSATETQGAPEIRPENAVLCVGDTQCDSGQSYPLGVTGLEPVTSSV